MSYARGNLWSSIGRGLRETGHLVGGLRERDRLLALEEQQRERDDTYHDLHMYQQGGRTSAPTTEREIPGTGAPRPEFESPEFIPEPGGRQPIGADNMLGDIDLGVEPREQPITVSETDPDWTQIGDYYFEDPEQRAQRIESERIESLMGDLRDPANRIAAGEVGPGDPGYGEDYLGLSVRGINPEGLRPPDDPAYQQETEYFLNEHGISARDQLFGPLRPAGGGAQPRGMSSGDASAYLQDVFGEWDEVGNFVGYKIPAGDVADLQRGLMNGSPEVGGVINSLASELEGDGGGGQGGDAMIPEPSQEEGPGLLDRIGDFGRSLSHGLRGGPADPRTEEDLEFAREAINLLVETGKDPIGNPRVIDAAAEEYGFTPEEVEAIRWELERRKAAGTLQGRY